MKKKYNSLEEREKQKSRDEEIKRFLEEHPELTLMEVGKKYDLTKQRVHQIKVKLVDSKPEKVNIKKL